MPAGPTPPATPVQCYEAGLWHLEHFGKNKTRGFPENARPNQPRGPTIPQRTSSDLAAIADAIRDVIRARILVLTEINGSHDEENDQAPAVSEELDDLASRLSAPFRYILTRSGSSQRVGIIYDARYVRLNAWGRD